jgi:hypothetical protein
MNARHSEHTLATREATEAIRALARGGDASQRAQLLLGVVDAVYSAVKYDNPEGGGHDGRDGPERRSLGAVLDAAHNHLARQAAATHTEDAS